ncbi:MAG: cell division protein CrgA [Microthrixaceae bacterium]
MAKPGKRRIEGTSSTQPETQGDTPDVSDAAEETSSGSARTVTSKRVTPKGTRPGDRPHGTKPGRYTAPKPVDKYDLPSPMWVPVTMFSLFGVGLLAIILNYANSLPGAPSNWYLMGGLLAILFGIITSTQLR